MKRLLVIVCLLSAAPAFAQRLPQTVLPDNYEIALMPDLNAAKFSGEEKIQVRLLEATRSITLNAAEIEFADVDIAADGRVQHAKVSLDPKLEQATLTVPDLLPAGRAAIHIKFNGTLNDQLRGFYLVKTASRNYAASQFEATDARRAFPCFDEPAMKATFAIRLIVDKGDTAISNSPIVSDQAGPGEGMHTLQFSPTSKMSSYLVALAVGDFECAEGSADEVPIRVCATPGHKDMDAFSLEAAEHIVKFYNQYYGIKYPYEKLDLVAIPDFAAGAMENAGAIFFRESLLFVDAAHTSARSRRQNASVIAHEIAHMWFGDLVTMQWWNDLWLNEGFATWIAPKPLEAWNPEWNSDVDSVQEAIGALNTDSYGATHAIRARADTPDEILELADEITYGKAADVLRMVEAYVGPETFRKGVNTYLQEHANGNATAEDFWNTLARVSGKPADKVMKSFVDQPGVPVIAARISRAGDQTKVEVSQHKFFYNQRLSAEPSDVLWDVPVCMKRPDASGKATTTCELLDAKEKTFTLAGSPPWVLINAGALGYYRSSYSPEMLAAISKGLNKELSSAERLMLVADAWSMVRAGRLDIGDYLQFVEAFKNEKDPDVMARVAATLHDVGVQVAAGAEAGPFQDWVCKFLSPAAKELGWKSQPGEDSTRRSLRETVLYTMGYVGRDPETLEKSRSAIEAYMKDPATLDPGLATAAARMAASSGDAPLYGEYLTHLHATKSPEEEGRFLYSLAEFRDPNLLTGTIGYALSDSVRIQTAPFLIAAALGNPAGRPATWDFVKKHWDKVSARIPAFAAGALVFAASDVCDAASRDDVESFFKAHPLSGAERSIRQSDEVMNQCIDLRAKQGPKLARWLNAGKTAGGK